MATLRVLSYFEALLGNELVHGGSRSEYREITVSQPHFNQTKLLAAETTWDAWEAGAEEPISDFDFLFIESDLSGVMVELTADKGGEIGTRVFTIGLIANIPLMLPSNLSYANYSADFGAGTLDLIDRIRVRNKSTTLTANVRVALFS